MSQAFKKGLQFNTEATHRKINKHMPIKFCKGSLRALVKSEGLVVKSARMSASFMTVSKKNCKASMIFMFALTIGCVYSKQRTIFF